MDCQMTRPLRLKEDKFCMMSWVLDRFVEYSQKAYIPELSLTIDEQLFLTSTLQIYKLD